MVRFLAWLAIVLLALWCVFIGGAWWGLYSTTLRSVSVAIALAVVLVWAFVAWRRPEWRPRSSMTPAIVLCVGALALSTAFSREPRLSVEYLGYAVLLAALYLFLVRVLASPFFRARMGVLAVGLAIVLGSAYAIANIAHWVSWWGLVGHLAVPPLRPESESLSYGNPSAVMTMVVLLTGAAAAAVGPGGRGRVILLGFLAALAGFAIVVSGSRSGWFGVGVAVVVTAVIWVADRGRRDRLLEIARSALRRPRDRVLLSGTALAFAAAAVAIGPTVIRRLTDSGADLRVNYVLAAGRMFAEAPLLGTGPGMWVAQRVRYTIAPETDYYIPHAHNVYAQTLAELGFVGAIAGLVLVAMVARLVIPALRDPDWTRRRWAWAATFGLAYFAAHDLLDFYANMPAVLFAAALPVAWLDATGTATATAGPDPAIARRRGRPVGRAMAAGLIAVVAASGGLLVAEGPADLHARAVGAYNDGRWEEADDLAVRAVAADPAWPAYQFTLGLTAAAVGDHARASEAFRRTALADDLPEAWLDLAAELAILGDDPGALEALDAAARLGLQRPAIAMAIGDLAWRLGDRDLAGTGFATAIAGIPSLAGDPWWMADPERAAAFPGLLDRAIQLAAEGDRWQVVLMAGDTGRALGLVPADWSSGATPPDIIAAWSGDGSAMDRIRAACAARPLDVTAVTWASRLERRDGDLEAGERYVQWAFGGSSGAGSASAETRVSPEPRIGRTIAGSVADFYGTYTYRRPTPWNPLVPSLVQLELVIEPRADAQS